MLQCLISVIIMTGPHQITFTRANVYGKLLSEDRKKVTYTLDFSQDAAANHYLGDYSEVVVPQNYCKEK